MRAQRVGLVLTIVNLALLGTLLSERGRVSAQPAPGVIRARAWEVVDQRGQIRASLTLAPSGDPVLRLHDHTGTIRVKLAATRDGAGLLLLDARTELGVRLEAGTNDPSLELTSRDGRRHIVRP